MSVATEFPPEVYIPDRARRTMPGGPARSGARHLALVPAGGAGRPRTERVAMADGGLSWPIVVAPAATPLRLTRRGLAVVVLATITLGMLLLAVAHLSAGAPPAAGAGSLGTVTVQPGDTLWSIAQRTAPNRDPRRVVDQLRQLNHLNSVSLTPGQTLKVS